MERVSLIVRPASGIVATLGSNANALVLSLLNPVRRLIKKHPVATRIAAGVSVATLVVGLTLSVGTEPLPIGTTSRLWHGGQNNSVADARQSAEALAKLVEELCDGLERFDKFIARDPALQRLYAAEWEKIAEIERTYSHIMGGGVSMARHAHPHRSISEVEAQDDDPIAREHAMATLANQLTAAIDFRKSLVLGNPDLEETFRNALNQTPPSEPVKLLYVR